MESKPDAVPEILVVSQGVKDIKFGGGSRRDELSRTIGRLRAGLQKKAYIPGNKLNAEWQSRGLSADGHLELDIYGGMLQGSDLQSGLDVHVFHQIPLDLKADADRSLPLPELGELLSSRCNDVEIDLGGNPQNMAMDLSLLLLSKCFAGRYRVNVLTSSDPFRYLRADVQDRVRELVEKGDISFQILSDVPDRISIQMPWVDGSDGGDFALTTEPIETGRILDAMNGSRSDIHQLFQSASGFISSDPLFEQIGKHGNPRNRFFYMNNASTAFRSMVANMAYGKDVILPMNMKEAVDVARVFEQRGAEVEAHNIKDIPFPSPIASNGHDVDPQSLKDLDHALWLMRQYNPPHPAFGGITFNYPITFGGEGGLVVGSGDHQHLACFTSCVHADHERELLEKHGDASQTVWAGKPLDMGAGDASATVIALFNTVSPSEFIIPHMAGKESSRTDLLQAANTIFVSALSRIVGAFLIRTKKTHWANIDLERLGDLLNVVGLHALMLARDVIRPASQPYRSGTLEPWGIRTVTWSLGSVAHPTPRDE
jgi:hypothetical protein